MGSQMGNRTSSYAETIQGLKDELEVHIAKIKSATDWADFVRVYKALGTIEEIAGVPKTTLEGLLDIAPVKVPDAPVANADKKSALELGDQVETEPATEIEKGS
jgi:hypothetical protein